MKKLISLIFWFTLAQLNGVHTVHLSSPDKIFSQYQKQTERFPHHVSFVTGQSEKFLAYEIIARTIYQEFHPTPLSESELERMCFLRYPSEGAPQDLEELFRDFPLRENYDTVSTSVAGYLVAMSPSLEENEGDESALAIFKENDRDSNLESCLADIFQQHCVPTELFEDSLEELLEEMPSSNKGGIVTQVFLPKSAPLHKVIYRSHPYGIPFKEANISQFFKDYMAGIRWESDPVPQLRFLPSGLKNENGFDLNQVWTVRYTLISSKELKTYAKKVSRVVHDIFESHIAYEKDLERQFEKITNLHDTQERDSQLAELSRACENPIKSLEYVEMISEGTEEKRMALAFVVERLLLAQKIKIATEILQREGQQLPEWQKLLSQLAVIHSDHGHLEKVKEIVYLLPPSPQKNLVVLTALSQFSETGLEKELSTLFPTTIEELAEMNVLEIEVQSKSV